MAARLNTRQSESARNAIQVGLLIKRLTDHAHLELNYSDSGFPLPPKGYMQPSQIQAAKILLDKAMSNAPTEVIADIEGELTINNITRTIIDPKNGNT